MAVAATISHRVVSNSRHAAASVPGQSRRQTTEHSMHLRRVTMVRLNPKQRTALADTFRQLGNLAIGGLGVGQFVSTRPLSWPLLVVGTFVWAASVAFGLLMLKGEEP